MWEFQTGNTFGATAFSSYGAFWISFWALVTFFIRHPGLRGGLGRRPLPVGLGHLHRVHVRRVAAHRLAVAFVFFLLTATFIILGIGNSGAATRSS